MTSLPSLSNTALFLLHLIKRRKYATLEELQCLKLRHDEKNLISLLIMKDLLRRQDDGALILTEKALRLLNEMENEGMNEDV